MTDSTTNEYKEQRLVNMRELEKMGYKPFGHAFKRTGRLAEIRAAYEEGMRITAAGRLMTVRLMGKSSFADIRDGSDRLQVYAQKNQLGDDAFKAFNLLDVGDHIGVEGTLFTTKTGEKTLKIEKWTLLSKALLPLPEKWHGLKNIEARYRQRYLDLVANPDVRFFFNKRILAIQEIRNYLVERGFFEVETPMIQTLAGGAAAKPFITHYSALNTDMYLRIAPELYLKRLLVGGFDKVFELNRNFRNEGLSRTHNPEFTMLEIYEAYSDVNGMKDLVQGLITHVAKTVFGSLRIGLPSSSLLEGAGGKSGDGNHEGEVVDQTQDISHDAETIDLTPPWREVNYRYLIAEKMGDDWFALSLEDARRRAETLGLTLAPKWNMAEITHEIYEKVIERSIVQPTFVTRFPAEVVPLAKTCEDDESVADVFELVIGGQEIAPAYTELNDPIEQRRRLETQAAAGSDKLDEDFLTALEHGMPPAGGMGIGIDRLFMILSGSEAIRDVILFPQLKPK